MKKLVIISFAILSISFSHAQDQVTTFILVRHAEKTADGSDDPALSVPGLARALRLVEILQNASVDAIYSTTFKRTRNTVTPLASARKMDIKSYDAFKADPIDAMLKDHAGGTVVICGHSNNIPWIANLLAGKEVIQNYDDSDYENLLIVDVISKGRSKITRLRF